MPRKPAPGNTGATPASTGQHKPRCLKTPGPSGHVGSRHLRPPLRRVAAAFGMDNEFALAALRALPEVMWLASGGTLRLSPTDLANNLSQLALKVQRVELERLVINDPLARSCVGGTSTRLCTSSTMRPNGSSTSGREPLSAVSSRVTGGRVDQGHQSLPTRLQHREQRRWRDHDCLLPSWKRSRVHVPAGGPAKQPCTQGEERSASDEDERSVWKLVE